MSKWNHGTFGIITKLDFQVGWYLGDTTESLALIAAGSVDIGVTYNEAAENQSIISGASVQSEYGFRVSLTSLELPSHHLNLALKDHFLLVGPKSNPASLDANEDDILTMFNKIVSSGNTDVMVRLS